LRFLASVGEHELAAAALATTLHNVTGMSLSVGFSFALSTLAGQAKGELMSRRKRNNKNNNNNNSPMSEALASLSSSSSPSNSLPITPVVFLLRGMLIQLGLVLPVGIWWLSGIESLLIRLGQSESMAHMASTYIKVLVPSLWAYSIQWTLTSWVQTIGMADVPAKAAMLGLALHVPFNYLFLSWCGMGFLGCGLATVCFQLVQMTFLLSYLFVYPQGKRRLLEATGGTAIGRTRLTFWNEFTLAVSSFKGFLQYLGLALPGLVIISEWWASETAIFLSGRLVPNPEESLAGMTIYQSINTFCFMFPMSFAIAGTARVSNFLGAGLDRAAAKAGNVSVVSAGVVSGLLGLLLFLLPHEWLPSLFAPDETGVIYEASRTIPLLALYVLADGLQVAINGIVKGCGRQCITIPIVVVAYWIVGVPLAYYLAFVRHQGESECEGDDINSYLCGDVGLVAGMTIGTWCHMLLLALAVFGTTNWKEEACKAKERVVEHK